MTDKTTGLVKIMAFAATFLFFKSMESLLSVGSEVMKHASKRVQKELN